MEKAQNHYKQNMENKIQNVSTKLEKSLQNFHSNMQTLESLNKKIFQEKTEKIFEKFQNTYYRLEGEKIEKEEKMKNKNEKTVDMKMLKQSEDEKKEKANLQVLQRLKDIETKRKEIRLKHSQKIRELLSKEENNFQRFKVNKVKNRKDKEDLVMYVLEKQKELMQKASLKDTSVVLNKLNAQ